MNPTKIESVTEAELARVLELDAKATEGPWEDDGTRALWHPFDESEREQSEWEGEHITLGKFDPDDLSLIAEYRTLTPRLARELAAARAALRKIEANRHAQRMYDDGKNAIRPKLEQAERERDEARAEVKRLKSDRVVIFTAELERAQEGLRGVCLLLGFDPSDGEGTSPEEVVEYTRRHLEDLRAAIRAARAQPEDGK